MLLHIFYLRVLKVNYIIIIANLNQILINNIVKINKNIGNIVFYIWY